MQMFQDLINWILGFGASVFVPIIMIIAGLIVKMKPKDAISAGLLLGIAFTGMSEVINFMRGAITPVAEAMIKSHRRSAFHHGRRLDNNVRYLMGLAVCLCDVPAADRN